MKENNYMFIFAKRLKELMEIEEISHNYLSKQTGIPRSNITCWLLMTREPAVKYLIILAKYFKVSTDYLLGLED